MLAIQVLLVLFFLAALFKVWQRYRAHTFSWRAAMLWAALWLIAIIVVIRPNSTAIVAKLFGIGRGADLVVYSALALVFYLLFRLMVKTEELNRQVTTLTRKAALNEKEKKV